MKKKTYFLYFLLGALIGLAYTFVRFNELSDYLTRGSTNFFAFGGIVYTIFVVKDKRFRKLWFLPLIFILAVITPMIALLLGYGLIYG